MEDGMENVVSIHKTTLLKSIYFVFLQNITTTQFFYNSK